MTNLKMNDNTNKNLKGLIEMNGYYSVEFTVDKPRPLYQFKIWKSESSPMFVVVKETSDILAKLKSGSVLNMTYYDNDRRHPKRQIETRIGPINERHEGRFQGHCTIDLMPVDPAKCN